MKIINLVGAKFGNGGIESFLANVSKQIPYYQDIEFIIVSRFKCQSIYEKEIIDNGGKFIYISDKPCGKFEFYNKLIKYFGQNKQSIVWIHASFANQYLYALISRISGIKKVAFHMHSVQNPSLQSSKRVKNYFYRRLLSRVPNALVACSYYSGKLNFENKKFFVVHNGIDCSRFKFSIVDRKDIREKYGVTDSFVLGQVGRLSYAKNQLFSIKLLEKLVKENKKIKLFIVGSGEDLNLLREKAIDLKLMDYIVFVPATERIDAFYSSFDILLFPSVFEGLGIAPLEAQCSGLNVICSQNITREIAVTSRVEFIELNDIDCWTKTVLKKSYKTPDIEERLAASEEGISFVSKSGFTYKNAFREMMDVANKIL